MSAHGDGSDYKPSNPNLWVLLTACVLQARAASAKTSKQIQEMIGSLNTSNAVVAFDKMEEKVSRGGYR
jgi:tellurite resistance protein